MLKGYQSHRAEGFTDSFTSGFKLPNDILKPQSFVPFWLLLTTLGISIIRLDKRNENLANECCKKALRSAQ